MKVAEKLRFLRTERNFSQEYMGKMLGISRRSYGLYELGKTIPNVEKIQLLAEIYNLSTDEILGIHIKNNKSADFLPIKGLAECGLRDWYRNSEMMAINIAKPADITDENAFAVIATGTSLIPEGIKQGFICICSPALPPQSGDIVFLEESSGHSSMKLYEKEENNFIHLKGYLPPDENGNQMAYLDQRLAKNLKILAPVVYIKRRV